jgi:mannose-6-phosphate isomerase-like protein (cupin superfamily)
VTGWSHDGPELSRTHPGGQLDEPGGALGRLGVTEWGERAPQVEVHGGSGGGVDAFPATPGGGERLDEDLVRLVQVAEQATLDDRPKGGKDLGIAQDVGCHRLGLPVPGEQLAEPEAEPRIPPRALGAPLHTHRNEDEYSFVVDGRFGLQLGAEVLEARPGDLVFKPRGVPHSFWNAGDEPARLLELISPAGFENYFRELARLLAAPGRDQAAITEVVGRYQLDIDFATIPTLAERHNLRLA